MVAIALKSTSSLLRCILRMRAIGLGVPTWIVSKVITVLNAIIGLGKGNTRIGNTYLLGDYSSKSKDVRYIY
jgi:hypothetical protein